MNISKLIKVSIVTITLSFAINIPAHANGLIPGATGNSDCTRLSGRSATECGDYAVNDFVYLAINASQFILGIVGSLTLLMFVIGGFLFLISAGNPEKVTQAKKIITAAVVGLVIVFSSFVIIRFVLGTLGLEWTGQTEIPRTTPSTPTNNTPN